MQISDQNTGQDSQLTAPSYYDTGYNDVGAGQTVWNDSDMNTTTSTTNGETAADTTWSNACTGF